MKYTFFFLSLFLVFHYTSSAMTEKQMMATAKLVRNTCTNKAKATKEQVDGMHNGDFELDKNGQCYLHCIMSTYKLLKADNAFDWEAGIQVISANAPAHIAEPAVESIKHCKDAITTVDDKCTASMEIARCIYKDNPGNYFLP